jgi:hypothetical protein
MEKKSKPGSETNITVLTLRTYCQILGLKILKFFDADPDSGTGCCQLWIGFWGSKYLDSMMQIRILGRDLGNPGWYKSDPG